MAKIETVPSRLVSKWMIPARSKIFGAGDVGFPRLVMATLAGVQRANSGGFEFCPPWCGEINT